MIQLKLEIKKINDNPTTGECIAFPEDMTLLLISDEINFSEVIYFPEAIYVECECDYFVYSYFGVNQWAENKFLYKEVEMKLKSEVEIINIE